MNADISIKPDAAPACGAACPHYELRFRSLFDNHRGLSFPCSCDGAVSIDDLKPQERRNYFFARALVGHDFAQLVVSLCA